MKRFLVVIVLGCLLCAAPQTRADKEKELLKTKARRACLTLDGKVGNGKGIVILWDLTSNKPIDTINLGKSIERVTLSSDAKILSVTTEAFETRVYDIAAAVTP